MQRGEWIRSDFGPGMGDGGEQSGFAGIGVADKSNVGDETQLQEELAFVAWLARLRKTRGLPGGGGEIAVAQSASAALAENEPLAVVGKIRPQLAFASGGSGGH